MTTTPPYRKDFTDRTEPTERSQSSSGEYLAPSNGTRRVKTEERFKDEFKSHVRRNSISKKSRDVLSMGNDSGFDDASSDFESDVTGSVMKNQTPASPELAEKEAKHVLWSKILVGLVLVVSTFLMGYFAYDFVKGEEEAQFKNQFNDLADEIVDQSKNNAYSSFSMLESFSKTITSLSLFANEKWPLITLPHFEIRASDYLDMSGGRQIAFAPIVDDTNREAWEAYAVAHQGWIQDGLDREYMLAMSRLEEEEEEEEGVETSTKIDVATPHGQAEPIREAIWCYEDDSTNQIVPETVMSKGPHIPLWQSYPAPTNSLVVNYNILSHPVFQELINATTTRRSAFLSDIIYDFVLFGSTQASDIDPKSVVLEPVFESFETDSPIVGFLIVVIPWSIYFNDVLSSGADPVVCVLQSGCGDSFTYEVSGPKAVFLGKGDLHDRAFDNMQVTSSFAAYQSTTNMNHYHTSRPHVQSMCDFSLHVYPSQKLHDSFNSRTPIFITMAVVGVFAFTSMVFLLYDVLVQRMQSKVVATALKTTAIVSSLFPQQVHERLFENALAGIHALPGIGGSNNNQNNFTQAPKHRLRSFLSDEEEQHNKKHDRRGGDASSHDAPIADLFPECTVMFCDIAGFTAWSSVREPSQVFLLLESVYAAFDAIAHRRKIFKVETIGDSYLAVCGLPTPKRDHALAMVRFAYDCLCKMKSLAQSLELELGPGTGDLTMRFGLHSGPVTAGVLRGEKTRFQLFGDTVNTASRMESTGQRNKIQVSEETAALLRAGGKDKWLTPRDEKVKAKGKGELQTYWANPKNTSLSESQSSIDYESSDHSDALRRMDSSKKLPSARRGSSLHASLALREELDEKRKRCVHWIAEIMVKLLKQIVARRAAQGNVPKHESDTFSAQFGLDRAELPIDEVIDIITLPKFDKNVAKRQADIKTVKLSEQVVEQLHSLIAEIALLYKDNPFHNFDHASHVTMSVSKLLARIVAPEELDPSQQKKKKHYESMRHDHTYGITSDPLTQFAVVFTALIHDADHPGCPNATLVKEKTDLAVHYCNRSVAEQNSLDLCWKILNSDKYTALRNCIYANSDEMKRFRQLVVNSIIATDISDKTLSEKRKARWNIAFHAQASEAGSSCLSERVSDGECSKAHLEAVNRKATIVIEHIIQASDVAHTMQHWHIYQKWNEKLFEEMYLAYQQGKLEKDPSESWYQGEIGFFDFYIIPLAKKLKECGVFGVSSAEYLNYAVANRREWEMRGHEVVKGLIDKYVKKATLEEQRQGVVEAFD